MKNCLLKQNSLQKKCIYKKDLSTEQVYPNNYSLQDCKSTFISILINFTVSIRYTDYSIFQKEYFVIKRTFFLNKQGNPIDFLWVTPSFSRFLSSFVDFMECILILKPKNSRANSPFNSSLNLPVAFMLISELSR